MEYRAVGNRCAVSLNYLRLSISHETILGILEEQKFILVKADIVELARKCIGVSKFQYGAHSYDAPSLVDCASFTKWLYGQLGIWLPRRAIQQCKLGDKIEQKKLWLEILFLQLE